MNKFTIIFEREVVGRWVDCPETVHHSSMTLAELAIWLDNGARPPGCEEEWRVRAIAIVARRGE